jgi:hypothetical protein
MRHLSKPPEPGQPESADEKTMYSISINVGLC